MITSKYDVVAGYWSVWASQRSGEVLPELLSEIPDNAGYPTCDPARPETTAAEDNEAAAIIWRRVLKQHEDGRAVHCGLPADWECKSYAEDYVEFFEAATTPSEIASAGVRLYAYYRQTGGNPVLAFRRVVTGLNRKLSH